MSLHAVRLFRNELAQGFAVDVLHDKERATVGGQAMFEGADNVGVLKLDGDLSLRGLIHPRETSLELFGLLKIEKFQADLAARFSIAGSPKVGHRALADLFEQIEALLDVRFGDTFAEERLEETHVGSTAGTRSRKRPLNAAASGWMVARLSHRLGR